MFQAHMKTFYDQNGYLVVNSVFTSEEMAPVRHRTEDLIAHPEKAPEGVPIGREGDTVADKTQPEAQNQSIRAMAFLVRFDPVYRAFAQNPKLLAITRGLIGPRIKVFRDQMLLKPPGGQAKPSHQDQSYFRVHPLDNLITAWIALDEATVENGCMCYVPGSHKHGILNIKPDPDRPVHHVPDTQGINLPNPVACPVPAGSVIFHHGCTLHHSADNNSRTWRKAVIFHYATSDAKSERDQLNAEVSLEID